MKINPLFDRVLIKDIDIENTTKSGFILASNEKQKPNAAVIISLGNDVDLNIKEGQNVIYQKYSGTEVKIEGQKYVLIKQSDILAIIQ